MHTTERAIERSQTRENAKVVKAQQQRTPQRKPQRKPHGKSLTGIALPESSDG